MKPVLILSIFLVVTSAFANEKRALTEEEIKKAKTWIGNAQLVAEQSFATRFENHGDVWFLSTTELPPKSFVYRIYKDDKELTHFEPNRELCPWASFDLQSVNIRDFDGDGLEDVGVIAKYRTGSGPAGAKPFPIAEIYLNDGKGAFVHDSDLHKRMSMAKVKNEKDLLHFARKPSKPETKKAIAAKPEAPKPAKK